jgi:hypothetical protein
MVDDGGLVRHHLPRTILDDEDDSSRQVIDVLLRARLVTAGEDSLQIAHEALALAWPRLRAWLDEDREGQRVLRHLTAAAQAWLTRDRDPAELYRGSRLQIAEAWASAHPTDLNGTESAFLAASRAAHDQQERSQRQVTRRVRRQLAALSVLGVVTAVAVSVAVVQGGGGAPDRDGGRDAAATIDNEALMASGPMTWGRAEDEGRTREIDWGPDCDTRRGTIKLPTVLAPPCVEPFTGDNGGATSQGVAADAIKVIYYQADPASDPVDVDTSVSAQTVRQYVDIFNQVFETYGRRVVVEVFNASGPDWESVLVDADAISRLAPFAVIGGPDLYNDEFADELARRRIVCAATCARSIPDDVVEEHHPYLWQDSPTPNQMAALTAEAFGKLAGPGLAEMAGEQDLRDRTRTYALIDYDTTDIRGAPWLARELEAQGIHLANINLGLDSLGDPPHTIISELQTEGVTTVIYAGEPVLAAQLTREATAQGYFPEWLLGPTSQMNTTTFARSADPQQLRHGFGVTFGPAPTAPSLSEPRRIYEWAYDQPPPDTPVAVLGSPLLSVFAAVHLAGPNLTPETFRDAVYRTPVAGGGPTIPLASRGDHGIWPDVDYGGTDDLALIWWDPDATGRDENGRHGQGMYRYAHHGQRHSIGILPESFEEAGLFDEDSSITVFDEIPDEDQTPDYPPPDL